MNFLLLLLLLGQNSSTITTYVGPALPAYGAQATLQPIDGLTAAIPDDAGGLYVASYLQNRVYRVNSAGTLSLIAGSSFGLAGDSGPAAAASLAGPTGLALDAAGNLYISDSLNNRVRKVTADGVIFTIVGNLNSPSGIAADTSGNVYVADTLNNQIVKVTPAGTITTIAGTSGTTLNQPHGVAVDFAGNLYIADTMNHVVRKVSTTGTITTIAGTGTAGFAGDGGPATAAMLNQPLGVSVDEVGGVYIADSLNHRIRRVSSNGTITTVAGSGVAGFSGDGGAATLAQFNGPAGVAVDPTGALVIADTGNNRARVVSLFGVINTAAGVGNQAVITDSGVATSTFLSQPHGIAVDSNGALYVADSANNEIRKVTTSGSISTIAGTGIPGSSGDAGTTGTGGIVSAPDVPATLAQLNYPTDIALDKSGNLYIVDSGNNRVRRLTASTGVIGAFAGNGSMGFGGNGGPASGAQLNGASAVAVDSSNNVYVADSAMIHKVNSAGVISVIAGTGFPGFSGDGGPATSAAVRQPMGLAVDSANALYIADTGNNRIRKISSFGVINTIAGTGTAGFSGDGGPATSAVLSGPTGVFVDATGNVLIADTGNHRIRQITTDGAIHTIAGTGIPGFSGDAGVPTSAQLNSPFAVRLDTSGAVYISDTANNRIRKIASSGITGTTSGPTGFAISNFAGTSEMTAGNSGLTTVGYGRILPASGSTTPAGLAIFGFRQSNVLVTEAGVPASPLIQSGRIYAEINGPVSTGIAIANPGTAATTIAFYFTGPQGNFATGTTTIAAGGQLAAFLNQSPFNGAAPLAGTFTFTSTQPVAVIALRGFTNERSEFLITTQPVASLTKVSSGTLVFPHYADGGGWTTEIDLVNPTDVTLTGSIQFLDQNGNVVDSSLSYSLPPRGSQKLTTPGTAPSVQVGSVRVIPAVNSGRAPAPSGLVVFSFHQNGVTVTQAGVPASSIGSTFRLYAEASGSLQTGIAISNLSNASATVSLQLMRLDGTFTGLSGTVVIPANGQVARFLNQIPGLNALPLPFQGILRISTTSSIAIIGLRGRYNERSDFLISTTPPTDEAAPPSTSEMGFPHFADAGGYTTQFILYSGSFGQVSSGDLKLFSQTGQPMVLTFK